MSDQVRRTIRLDSETVETLREMADEFGHPSRCVSVQELIADALHREAEKFGELRGSLPHSPGRKMFVWSQLRESHDPDLEEDRTQTPG